MKIRLCSFIQYNLFQLTTHFLLPTTHKLVDGFTDIELLKQTTGLTVVEGYVWTTLERGPQPDPSLHKLGEHHTLPGLIHLVLNTGLHATY